MHQRSLVGGAPASSECKRQAGLRYTCVLRVDAQAQATRGISPVGSVRTTSPLLMQEQKDTRACGSGRGTRDKVRIPLSVNDLA